MRPNLTPLEPLSQVIFVYDYLQLVFGEEIFSIYNPSELVFEGSTLVQGQAGFCDSLVRLIGQRAEHIAKDEHMLSLTFEGGAQLYILPDASGSCGPEAFEFAGNNNFLVVEQNT
jgi:hypothetical protein